MQSPIDLSPAPVCCYAIDSESTKLAIPVLHVRQTTGLQRLTPTPALCRLFMDGRCRQGSQCHQIHANGDVVRQLRREVLAAPPCCQMHTPWAAAAAAQQEAGTSTSQVVVIGGEAVPTAFFCPTVGLHTALAKNRGNASTKDLCRSHVSGGLCRYGDDCNYLHLCKALADRITSEPALLLQQQHLKQSPAFKTIFTRLITDKTDYSGDTHRSPTPPMPSFLVPDLGGCRCSVHVTSDQLYKKAYTQGQLVALNGSQCCGDEGLSAISSSNASASSSPNTNNKRFRSLSAKGTRCWSHNPYGNSASNITMVFM